MLKGYSVIERRFLGWCAWCEHSEPSGRRGALLHCPTLTSGFPFPAVLQAWYTGEGALGSLQKFSNGF